MSRYKSTLNKTRRLHCPHCGRNSARFRRVVVSTTTLRQKRVFICPICKSDRKH